LRIERVRGRKVPGKALGGFLRVSTLASRPESAGASADSLTEGTARHTIWAVTDN